MQINEKGAFGNSVFAEVWHLLPEAYHRTIADTPAWIETLLMGRAPSIA